MAGGSGRAPLVLDVGLGRDRGQRLAAVEIAQAKPETTLFIDDRPRNLVPARDLGINTILFESASQLRSELEQVLGTVLKGA